MPPVTRVAVVTGAARGIGAATVLALARQGWSVLAVDRGSDDPAVPYPLATETDLAQVLRQARQAAGADRVTAYPPGARDQAALAPPVVHAGVRGGGPDP